MKPGKPSEDDCLRSPEASSCGDGGQFLHPSVRDHSKLIHLQSSTHAHYLPTPYTETGHPPRFPHAYVTSARRPWVHPFIWQTSCSESGKGIQVELPPWNHSGFCPHLNLRLWHLWAIFGEDGRSLEEDTLPPPAK